MFTAAEEIPWPGCDSFFGASFAVVFDAMGGILACLRLDGAGRVHWRQRHRVDPQVPQKVW
jgi:hypothetical protein